MSSIILLQDPIFFKEKKIGISFVNIWPQKLKSELAIYYTVALIAKFFFTRISKHLE